MRVFISQPMRGKSVSQIILERNEVVECIGIAGGTVIPSTITSGYPDTIEKRIWCLGKEIMLMSQADAVYFMNGWENSNGCKIEHTSNL